MPFWQRISKHTDAHFISDPFPFGCTKYGSKVQWSFNNWKLWKWRKETLILNRVRRPWKGGFSSTHHCSQLDPPATGGRNICSLPSNNEANEKRPQAPTLTLHQGTFLQNHPSQLPPLLYKSTFLFFVLQNCPCLVIVCRSQIACPLLFQNRLNFPGWTV